MYWSRVLVCLAEHSSSARDHVGNFPTDIETSSLPAACHGYYQIQRLTPLCPHRTDIASDASRMTGWHAGSLLWESRDKTSVCGSW